jgi:RNA polymerase sigma factor (sigma-70 family)
MREGSVSAPQARTDAELAVQLQAGDPAALGQLYDRHVRGIHDFLARFTRDASAAEDLAHSTFLQAWERRQTLRDPARVRSWLYATAHNLGLNWVTRYRRAGPLEEEVLDGVADTAPGPEAQAVATEVADLVWAAASSLEARQYAVLDLSVRRGLSTREVADVLGVPVGHAAVLVNRAREALGNAVRYLLVARRRDHCERLAALIPAGVRALTAQQRSAVDHHMRRCDSCQELGRRLTAPAELLGALLPLQLPASLGHQGRERLVAAVRADRGRPAATSPVWPPHRRFWDGRMRLLGGLAVLLLLLLGGGGTAVYVTRTPAAALAERAGTGRSGGPAVAGTTASPSPGQTPAAASTPGPSPSASQPGTPSPAATPTPRTTARATATGTPAPGPAPTPTTPTATSTPAPTPTPTATPTPTPTPPPPFGVTGITLARDAKALCTVDITVTLAHAIGGESVQVTLLDGALKVLATPSMTATAGAGSLVFQVPLLQLLRDTLSATTTPSSQQPSNQLPFSCLT